MFSPCPLPTWIRPHVEPHTLAVRGQGHMLDMLAIGHKPCAGRVSEAITHNAPAKASNNRS